MGELPNYATNIALIRDGVVVNTIWGMFYNTDEYASWGYEAIPFHDLNVSIGDTYHDGHFYKQDSSNIVEPMSVVFGNQIAALNNEIDGLDLYIIDLEYSSIIDDLEE